MTESELTPKITKLFRTIFVELADARESEVKNASREALESWDSANQLLLVTCLEEEFNLRIPDGEAADIDSYSRAAALVLALS